jgi:hypothetical protein
MSEAIVVEFAKALVGPVAAVILAWALGNRISAKWSLWQKRREQAQTAANEFYRLYGEFFSIWKLWNYSLRQSNDANKWEERQWDLLKRAAAAEAGIEALMVKIASERFLTEGEIKTLGCFRQGYQQLRESIRDRRKLDWPSSDCPEYLAFKRLASNVAGLASTVDSGSPLSRQTSQHSLEVITSNRWEVTWFTDYRSDDDRN